MKPDNKPKPAHRPGPNFNPNKTPEPDDAPDVYDKAVPDPNSPDRKWWGQNSNGDWYRFSSDNAGGAHFSGSYPANSDQVPIQLRR